MYHYIIIDETRAVGIGNERGEMVLLFTEHTTQEIGEAVCRFLRTMSEKETNFVEPAE